MKELATKDRDRHGPHNRIRDALETKEATDHNNTSLCAVRRPRKYNQRIQKPLTYSLETRKHLVLVETLYKHKLQYHQKCINKEVD